MKIVHHNQDDFSAVEALSTARQYEKDGANKEAVSLYLKLLKKQPRNERIYDRLMILYRKLKEPEKELQMVETAIRVFSEQYDKKHKAPGKKILQLSSALMKATGLADKKGNSLYAPQPLARWHKRKQLLVKKKNK